MADKTHLRAGGATYQGLSEGDSDIEKAYEINTTHVHKFDHEKNKAILDHGPGILAYWIHILALACTAVVVQLSFRQVYWADEDNWGSFATNKWSFGFDQEEVGNILQFPAKLHEIFIVSSLSTIILSIVRRRLIGSRGVPFGFLMGGYQANSPEYLFSKSFWGPLFFTIRHNKSGAALLGVCIGLGIIYANVVGPCSAVLIVPNLSWWDVPSPFNSQRYTTYVDGDRSKLYPTNLDSVKAGSYNSVCTTSNMTALCPGFGNRDLQDYATAYANEGIAPNITISQLYSRASRVLSTDQISTKDNSSVLIGSTLHSDITELAGLFWHYVRSNNGTGMIHDIGRPQLQPESARDILSSVVQVQCSHSNLYDARTGVVNVTFPTSLFTNSVASHNGTGPSVPPEYWDFDQNYTDTSFTWIDLSDVQSGNLTLSASIGALAAVPYRRGVSDGSDKVYIQEKLLVSCVVDARWAATEIVSDPTKDNTLVTNITDGTVFFGTVNDTSRRARYGMGGRIQISTDWANLLNVADTAGHTKGDEIFEVPAIEALMLQFISNGTANFTTPNGTFAEANATEYRSFQPPSWDPSANYDQNMAADTIGTILSLVLADGLSRVSYGQQAYNLVRDDTNPQRMAMVNLLTQNDDEAKAPTYITADELGSAETVPITFSVRRYGWGYGYHTKTAKFAISMLLLHAAIALTYILYGLIHWMLNRWSSHTWNEFGELLALAMLSSEPKSLQGAGAGIDKWDTWKLDVMVRVSGRDKVELVFGDRYGNPAAGHDRKVERKQKYR